MPTPSYPVTFSRRGVFGLALLGASVAISACGSDSTTGGSTSGPIESGTTSASPATSTPANGGTLRIGAIPDQDPEKLARLYSLVSTRLSTDLGVKVEYVPVADYPSAVGLFRAGDLDLVWFGGLTGVQARLQTPGSVVIAQRTIDEKFRSVFIANADAGIAPIKDVAGLSAFADTRFTFGSESSTSGRLMPQYFLDQAGVGPDGFDGEAGFSGSHDKTIDLVAAGTYEAGALNEQVWRKRLAEGTVDTSKVVETFVTPGYHDYHWILAPGAAERFGASFEAKVRGAITGWTPDNADDAAILDLFGATGFIPSEPANYVEIESIGRKLGLITD